MPTSLSHNTAPTLTLPSTLSFAPAREYNIGSQAFFTTSADVNGDGRPDLISSHINGTVSVRINGGGGTFLFPADYIIGQSAVHVAIADLDGDGRPDLIAASDLDGYVAVLKQEIDGSFASKAVYHTSGSPQAVACADVTGDGKLDLLVANFGSPTISVLVNFGEGQFTAAPNAPAGDFPADIVAVDVNGDGNIDAVVSNYNSRTISVLLNKGHGAFGAATPYSVGAMPAHIGSGDFNSDGKPDLYVVNRDDNTVSVLLNQGDGTFTSKSDYATGNSPGRADSVDVDGDGKLDLVVSNVNNSSISVLRGNGDGTFAARFDVPTPPNPVAVVNADMNGDGMADLIVTNGANTVSVLFNAGVSAPRAFTEQTAVTLSPDMQLNDADADWAGGSLRLQLGANAEEADSLGLPASNPGGSAIWLDTNGNKLMAGTVQIGSADAAGAAFNAAWTLTFAAGASNALVQATGRAVQFNNSSDAPGTAVREVSITATDSHGAAASVVQKVGVTVVNDAPTIAGLPATAQAVTAGQAAALAHVSVADADSTTLSVTLTASNGSIGHLVDADPNTAGIQLSGTAASINTVLAGATFTAAAGGAAGIDISVSDGVAAPVVEHYQLLANTAPTISVPQTISFFQGYTGISFQTTWNGISIVDLNGDGKADLVGLVQDSQRPGKLLVHINDGASIVAPKVEYDIANGKPISMLSVDVNGDGKADLVAATDQGDLSVRLNKGDGSFFNELHNPGTGVPTTIFGADLNGDGKLDIVAAGPGYGVGVRTGNGDGTFAATVMTGNAANTATCADVNGDGKLDLITTIAGGINKVTVSLGRGDGTFDLQSEMDAGNGPLAVTCADLNNDGKTDLLIPNSLENSVSVLMGNGDGSFAARVDYAVRQNNAGNLVTADLDGDGKLDMIVQGSSTFAVYRGNGDGSFGARIDYDHYAGVGIGATIAIGDLTGDGRLDLVLAGGNKLEVASNTSTANVAAFTEQTAVALSPDLQLNDANGDWAGGSLRLQLGANAEAADSLGLPTSNPGGSAIWLDTNGNKLMAGAVQIGSADAAGAAFNAAWTLTFAAGASNALVQATGRAVQFNNSSDAPGTAVREVSITATNSHGAAASVVQTINVTAVNDAPTIAGVPATAQAVTVGQAAALAHVSVADVDSTILSVTLTASNGSIGHLVDADTHTAGIQLSGTAVSINAALADATFTAAAGGAAGIEISVSDGVAAPVVAHYQLAANTAPTISLPLAISFSPSLTRSDFQGTYKGVSIVDLNGDGKAELVDVRTNSVWPGILTTYVIDDRGSFPSYKDSYVIHNGKPIAMLSVDVNGDGKADVITATDLGDLSVYLNKGDGSFFNELHNPGIGVPTTIFGADLNGDGKLDIVATGPGYGVGVLTGNGDGTFSAPVMTGNAANTATCADVNGDGKLDLITTIAGSVNRVTVSLGRGDGTFALHSEMDVGTGPLGVTCADLNNDGKTDLLVPNSLENTVSVLMGNGDGSFAARVNYAVRQNIAGNLVTADLDGDGRLDMIVEEGSRIDVYRGNGDGTFGARIDYNNPYGAGTDATIAIGHLNGDGLPDLVLVGGHVFRTLINTSAAVVSAFTEQTAVALSPALQLNDADGDWAGGSLRLQLGANAEAADRLALPTSNPGGSAIWLDTNGNKLMAGNVQIGSADAAGAAFNAAWTLTFAAGASNALVQATARAVQFNNSSDTPGTAARGVTITATDSHGAAASVVQTINVTAVNDAPTIAGLPPTAQAVTVGQEAALADISVADVDSTSLSVTLTASNGSIGHLVDADLHTAGIQLSGTAASINAALDGATFTAAAAGAASINISLSDGVVATPVAASYHLTASAVPAPTPPTPPTPPAPSDHDGASIADENGAPGLKPANGGAPLVGDGNGDGLLDSQQSAVASLPFLNTATAQSNPSGAASVYITLVGGGVAGKVDAASVVTLGNVHQLNAPANLPAEISMPLGQIGFTSTVQKPGDAQHFSLYLDAQVAVNGFWQSNAAGVWTNLASAPFGGALVIEGGKTRLDFTLVDGGQFDADGKADGVITSLGGAGSVTLSIVGHPVELPAGTHFWF